MEFSPKRKTFDVHMHIGEFGEWVMKKNPVHPFRGREVASAEDQEQYMKKMGITKAVVMPHYTPDQAVPFEKFNPIVLDAVKRENIFGALFVSPLPENTERTRAVLDSLPMKKIVALKMSPDSWPKGKYTPDPATWDDAFKENMELIVEAAKKHNLVIQSHTGSNNSDMMNFVPFIEKYGEGLKFHFVHMGGTAGGHFALVPRFVEWLKSGLTVYCDTSFCRGFGPPWLVKELLEKYPEGLDNVMFASDNPWGLYESEYWRIEGIDCPEDVKNKIFYENAVRVYEQGKR